MSTRYFSFSETSELKNSDTVNVVLVGSLAPHHGLLKKRVVVSPRNSSNARNPRNRYKAFIFRTKILNNRRLELQALRNVIGNAVFDAIGGNDNILSISVKKKDSILVALKKEVEFLTKPVVIGTEVKSGQMKNKQQSSVNIPEEISHAITITRRMTLVNEFLTTGIEKTKRLAFKEDADFLKEISEMDKDALFALYDKLDAQLAQPIHA